MDGQIPNDRLRQMLDELLEEPVFSRLTPHEQGAVEGILDALDADGKVSPMRAGVVMRLAQKHLGIRP